MSKVTYFVCKCNSKYDLLMLSIKNLWRYLLFNFSVVSSTKIELLAGMNTSKVIGTASGEGWRYQAKTNYFIRGGSRATATSRMKHFVIIVNSFQPLTIITKRFILDIAAALDRPLGNSKLKSKIHFKVFSYQNMPEVEWFQQMIYRIFCKSIITIGFHINWAK